MMFLEVEESGALVKKSGGSRCHRKAPSQMPLHSADEKSTLTAIHKQPRGQ